MQTTNTQELGAEARRAAWNKIIEDYQASGESQINYCKQHNINKDHFGYYLSRWRRTNVGGTDKVAFVPIQVMKTLPQDKWLLNIASDVSLELPNSISMQQLSELIINLRKAIC